MLFCILLDCKLYRALYSHQRSSLEGLISKFGHSLEFLSPSLFWHLWRVKSMVWGALFRLRVAGNVAHFAFEDNNVYRLVTGSAPQKIL